MNKKLFLPFLISLAVLFPTASHAAFSLTQVMSNGDGKAYTATNGPTYSTIGGGLDPLQACTAALNASGLDSTRDTYCVYDTDEEGPIGGSSFYGSGGGATGCQSGIPAGQPGSCAGNPPNPVGSGFWPPNLDSYANAFTYDGGYTPGILVKIYQSTLTQQNLTTVYNTITNYNVALFNHTYAQSCRDYAQQNGLDASGCPADPGTPTDPGYDDVCSLSHKDAKGTIVQTVAPVGPAAACTVFYSAGQPAQKPVATLTASPTSVIAGNSSLLTYSCSNNSTSASINNGVGVVSPASAGSKSVTPGATTTYTLTCTNAAGSSTATATVSVEPTLTGSCSVSPTTATTGTNVTWSATASGGNGTYAYSWSGTDSLSGSSASVSKSYSAAGAKTGSVTLTSGSQTITQSCSNSLTVTSPATSDLSAGGVSPSSATAGTAVTLSATIANTGTGSTNAGFTDLFQRATDSSGTGATDIGTYNNGVLGANASNAASLSYTFSSAGTYYVRACADKSSAGSAGTIAESNEGNNCGPWSVITVANAVQPTPTCSLSASPSTIPSTLTWSSTNATSCTGGGFSTGGAISGSVSTNVAGAYTLSCTGTGGSCSTSTNVGGGACTAPTGTITANPTRVKSGDSSTITYSATGITNSCTVTGPGVNQTIPANSCTVPGSSASTGPLTTQSVYILTCDGVERGRAVVNVLPKIIEF